MPEQRKQTPSPSQASPGYLHISCDVLEKAQSAQYIRPYPPQYPPAVTTISPNMMLGKSESGDSRKGHAESSAIQAQKLWLGMEIPS